MISVNSRRRIVTYGLHEVCMRQPWAMCLNRVIYSSDSQDHQRLSRCPDLNGYCFFVLCLSVSAAMCRPAGCHMPPHGLAFGSWWGGTWRPTCTSPAIAVAASAVVSVAAITASSFHVLLPILFLHSRMQGHKPHPWGKHLILSFYGRILGCETFFS